MSGLLIHCPVGESHCSILDELKELRRRVITDPLTGLYNHAHLQACLHQEFERTQRTGMATAFIMIDLDHFKKINDTYGHETGNQVLLRVANILESETRKLDICCRYGGEEFAVILPSTELMLAKQVAERFRGVLEHNPISSNHGDLNVTASLGVAVCNDPKKMTVETLIEHADKSLYQAKQSGRNQVHCRTEYDWTLHTQVSQDEKNALGGLFSD